MESVTAVLGNPTINTMVLAVAIYFLRDFVTTVRELRKEMDQHRLEVAKEYATREEVRDSLAHHEKVLHGQEVE